MPDMQRMDQGAGDEGRWCAPEAGVRELSPFLDARVRHRPDWPFLYSCEGDGNFINRAPRTTKYKDAEQTGVALF